MMTVRDAIHALEQMPEWHVLYAEGPLGEAFTVEEIVENVEVGGVVIRG
jgi:hypothetical protein